MSGEDRRITGIDAGIELIPTGISTGVLLECLPLARMPLWAAEITNEDVVRAAFLNLSGPRRRSSTSCQSSEQLQLTKPSRRHHESDSPGTQAFNAHSNLCGMSIIEERDLKGPQPDNVFHWNDRLELQDMELRADRLIGDLCSVCAGSIQSGRRGTWSSNGLRRLRTSSGEKVRPAIYLLYAQHVGRAGVRPHTRCRER